MRLSFLIAVFVVPLLLPDITTWRCVASRRFRVLMQSSVTIDDPTMPWNESDARISGYYEQIGVSYVVGVQLAAVPGTDKFLFMERPSNRHPDGENYNAGVLDVHTREFTNVECNTSLENAGHSFLPDGRVAVLAGHKPQSKYPEGRKGIRILDLETNKLQDVGTLEYGHWLATATQLPNGQIVVMGDSPSPVGPGKDDAMKNPFYEIWDPTTNAVRSMQLSASFLTKTKYFYYPMNYVLPTGDLFIWCNTYGQIIEPLTAVTRAIPPRWLSITTHMMTAYPFGGSSVMLPLTPENNYQPEIMVFGGQWDYGYINTTGVDLSMRLRINMSTSEAHYSFAPWEVETMPTPRLTFSSVLLPNGKVLLIGGAKVGLMGDAARGGVAMANEPNLVPALYDPQAPAGKRYTELAQTLIPRLLHSTAGLTTNGTVLVAGGDRSNRFWSTVPYSPSPTSFPEYRNEIFHPPFVFDTEHKPTITDCPSIIKYGESLNVIEYTIPNASSVVTSVVLVAPSSDTHTRNMHQRLVGLRIVESSTEEPADSGKSVSVQGPPNANIAPPGLYMLFLLNGDVYGQAKWVKVQA